jgi:tripartite-type tricarboxylate transporter receptor subunit TctC
MLGHQMSRRLWEETMKVAEIGALGVALTCLAAPAFSQTSNDYCQGKSLTLVVGSPPGGGYDTYGRFVAEHLGRSIPGRCGIVVQNMPGAGSLRAANYLFQQAPGDGMTIGMIQPNLVLDQVFGSSNVHYDLRKFRWIGRIATSIDMTVAWRPSPVNSIEDAKRQQITLAAATANGLTAGFPRVMNAIVGTQFKIISGYGGTAAIALAMERGEVQGAHMNGETLLAEKQNWLKENKISMLVQYSQVRDPEFSAVPAMVEFAQTPEQKTILSLFAATTDIGRPLVAPPSVANDRVAALRAAFTSMADAAEFRADVTKRKIAVNILPGGDLEKLVNSSLAISPSLVKVAEEAWTGKK